MGGSDRRESFSERISPVTDKADLERIMLGRSPRFQAMLNRSRQSIKAGRGLSSDAFWAAVRKRAEKRKAGGVKKRKAKG